MTTNAKVAIELYVDDKGSLRVKQFSEESRKGFKEIESAGTSSAGKVAGAWEKVKGVWGTVALAVGAAITAITALVVTSAREAKELEKLAGLAKMTSEEFSRYAFATEQVGISAEKLGDISKDVQDKLGDFIATGGGEFADFFENVAGKVGLTSAALQQMSGPDALIAIKKAMDDANVSAAEQVFYMEALANDASLLIPILQDGGAAMKEQANRAKELGVSLSEVDSKKLLEAGKATKETTSAFGGLKNAIAVEFAPVVADVMNWLTELIVGWKDEALKVTGVFVNIAESAVAWKEVFSGRLSFFEFATMDAKELDKWLEKNRKSSADLGEAGSKAQGAYQNEIKASTQALEDQEKTRQKAITTSKKEAEEKEQAEKEMYEEAGFGAEKYFTKQANELVEKAKRWKKHGGDIVEVERWLYDEIGKLGAAAYEKNEIAAGMEMEAMQAKSRFLSETYTQTSQEMTGQLAGVGVAIDSLNGKSVGLSATFDGSAVISGVDSLIGKFDQLKRAAASYSSASSPEAGSYENTDSSLSASQVAAAETAYYNSSNVTVNVSQQVSRSDVTSIAAELKRTSGRG